MGSVVKADRIDEILWKRHRRTIERLYVQEQRKLEKEDGVIEYMKKHHGFIASKSQYELHFKKWRLRKNLTKAEWRKIIRFMKERAVRSEHIEVRFNRTVLSKERLDREIARYGSAKEGHNGPHEGLCDLPEGVTIRPLSSVLTSDISNVHTVQALPRSPQTAITQSMTEYELYYSGASLTASPSSTRNHLREFYLYMGQYEPFSWLKDVKWDTIMQTVPSSQQLTHWKCPPAMQLDAAFYPKQQTLMALPKADENTILLMYLTSSILNNMTQSGQPTLNNAHKWLKALPRPIVSRFLESLPAQFLDVLRERVFAAAIGDGDADTVLAMLELNLDPREKIMSWPSQSTPMYPLEGAIEKGHFLVAKTITSHICRGATLSQLNELLAQLLDWIARIQQRRICNRPFRDTEIVELLSMTLSAGASPVGRCIAVVNGNFDLVKQIIEAGAYNIDVWLRAGLLEECFRGSLTNKSLIEIVLVYSFHEHLHQLPTDDPEFRIVLLSALHSAVLARRMWAVEQILLAFDSLGYYLDDDINSDAVTGGSIIQACRYADWDQASSLILAHISPTNEKTQNTSSRRSHAHDTELLKVLVDALKEAIDEDDIDLTCDLLEDPRLDKFFGTEFVERAVSLGRDQMAATIVRHKTNCQGNAYEEFLVLMNNGRTAAVSALLRGESHWNAALEAANNWGNFGPLDNILYPILSSDPYVKPTDDITLADRQQICLRAIAYHASETNNQVLCKWLLESGMDMDELIHNSYYIAEDENVFISKRQATRVGFDKILQYLDTISYVWPSLLAIAAEQNHLPWIKFLLAEGANCRDSMALLHAVKCKAEVATIKLLLESAKNGVRCGRQPYGAAALREAIRHRDLDMIDMLCDKVDINMVESSTRDLLDEKKSVSPMGEAIRMGDLEIVRILLNKGASPNACVAYDGLELPKNVKSWLPRVTPLLAAIDAHNLPMVKMLVENGAEIYYVRKLGFLRTPLERAAEVGNFDIVRYLVDQGALIDTAPVRSGGTALQLAAMNGYVGIATFLLEQGADPNYPPAEGDGRTAFEAAAEWGRVDMMSLLMKAGVLLDLQVGDPQQSQYERALNFAEKNGHMASKRFVVHLYTQKGEGLRGDGA